MTIKAVIFDFGQTLVDSADGFRRAEKEAQDKLFKDLSLTLKDTFLENYRRIRKQFHDRSNFSRKSIWNEVYYYHCLPADVDLHAPHQSITRIGEIFSGHYCRRGEGNTTQTESSTVPAVLAKTGY